MGQVADMAMISINKKTLLSALSCIFVICLLFITASVAAMSTGYFGGGAYGGGEGNGDFVLPKNYYYARDGVNIAIHPDQVYDSASFVRFLRNINDTGDNHLISGSAYILCTMLASSFQKCMDDGYINSGRRFLPAGVIELEKRLSNPNLAIDWNTRMGTETLSNYANTLYGTSENDIFDYTSVEKTYYPIKFFNGSDLLYRLARDCANPVGVMSELPKVKMWKIEPSVSLKVNGKTPTNKKGNFINYSPVIPGDKIKWTHSIINKGPDSTDQNVIYHLQNRGDLNYTWGNDHPVGSGFTTTDTNQHFDSSYPVSDDDVGYSICRATSAFKKAWDWDPGDGGNGWVESGSACVKVPYNYKLTPTVALNVSGAIDAGTQINVTPSVSNSGPTKSMLTKWELTRTVAPSAGVVVSTKSDVVFRSSYITDLDIYNDLDTDLPIGSKICYTLRVKPASSTNSDWIKSAPICVTIGKQPKTQIWGGDLITGGDIQTSQSLKKFGDTFSTFGSWGEYAFFAEGTNKTGGGKGMASGSAFANTGMSGATVCSYSTLSFTNTLPKETICASGTIGHYSNTNPFDIVANFPDENPTRTISGTVSPTNLPSGTHNASGNINLLASKLLTGQSIIIKSAGTVTIEGDQTYHTGPYADISKLPQLVIIAKDIIIANSVTQVDAWLIAKPDGTAGSIQTCKKEAKTASECNTLLKINGPVVTDKLYLYRTAGSGTGPASGDPAEIINLRADAYLWAYARTSSTGRLITTHTTELPPRY
jgi:hypothetical protein